MNCIKLSGIALLLLPGFFTNAFADERGHRHEQRSTWQHRDIARFHERDAQIWRSGNWHHGRHNGRMGWWWVVAGTWYFYPTRVAPYPDPYLPPTVTVAPPAAQYWYYCRNPAGYYPYVGRCRVSWQAVPATVQ